MRVGDLHLLLSLAATGSFTAAAKRCQIARSSASRRLAELEDKLGAVLFERSTRHVTPTAVGERFLGHAQRAFEHALQAARSVDGATSFQGQLRVSAPPVLSSLVVIPAALSLMAEHEGVTVVFDANASYVDVELDRIDLALRMGEHGEAHAGVVLGEIDFHLAGAVDTATPSDPTQLDPRDLLGVPQPFSLRRGDEEHRVTPRGRLRTSDLSALLAGAAAGLGLARVPGPMLRGASGVRRVLPQWCAGRSTIRIVFQQHRPLARELAQRIQASPMLPRLLAKS